jgi:hypothetical protein
MFVLIIKMNVVHDRVLLFIFNYNIWLDFKFRLLRLAPTPIPLKCLVGW